jgi:hypothetical protein
MTPLPGSLMVRVLAIGPKVGKFKHGQGDGFLGGIIIHSTHYLTSNAYQF